MVKITVFVNRDRQIVGFDCLGHAQYASENDIVCAAVSALTINCINSVEALTDAKFRCDSRQESGEIAFRLQDTAESGAQLLLRSLILGLQDMESNYEENIDLIFEEV